MQTRRSITIVAICGLAMLVIPAVDALASTAKQQRPAPGGIGVRLVGRVGDEPRTSPSQPYIIESLAPGSSVNRQIEIGNSTSAAAAVAVYPAAAGIRAGLFTFAAGRTGNLLSRSTSLERPLLHLAPGERTYETVTITVPRSAPSGEAYAVIWAEVSAPARAAGVKLVNRVGVRVYASIGPGGGGASNFTIGRLSGTLSPSRAPTLIARVRNTGARTLVITGSVSLADGPGGLRAGPVRVHPMRPLPPGTSTLLMVPLDDKLPRGPWRASLDLRSGDLERTATATITFPAAHSKIQQVEPVTDAVRYLVFVALLAVMTVAALGLLRHRVYR